MKCPNCRALRDKGHTIILAPFNPGLAISQIYPSLLRSGSNSRAGTNVHTQQVELSGKDGSSCVEGDPPLSPLRFAS